MALADAIRRRLGPDSRGPQGIYSRGANIYGGGSNAAHSGGGPQFGRPPNFPAQQAQAQGQTPDIYFYLTQQAQQTAADLAGEGSITDVLARRRRRSFGLSNS